MFVHYSSGRVSYTGEVGTCAMIPKGFSDGFGMYDLLYNNQMPITYPQPGAKIPSRDTFFMCLRNYWWTPTVQIDLNVRDAIVLELNYS